MNREISLNVNCPVCGKSLMDHDNMILEKPSIKIDFEQNNKRWIMRLCSVYGNYNVFSEIGVEKEKIINFYCPHCQANLKSRCVCQECRAPMVSLALNIGGTVNVCTRKGCKKHYLAFEEITDKVIGFFTDLK